MSESGSKEGSGGRREDLDPLQTRLAYGLEVFQELFTLLEEYAPVWYTEEHQRRTMRALKALEESRQLARSRAARSHRAGGP